MSPTPIFRCPPIVIGRLRLSKTGRSKIEPIPIQVGGEFNENHDRIGADPSRPVTKPIDSPKPMRRC